MRVLYLNSSRRFLREVCHPYTALLRSECEFFPGKYEKKKKKGKRGVKNAKLVVFNLK